MLQPSQIETVSLRFQTEIAEVRGFLHGTGIPVETPAALDAVVRRLESNRAFHRDLGSHVWMLLYSGATVPETLAVLAVATLGARFAATADEDSTHDLLRFVMESRSQLAGKPVDRSVPGTGVEPLTEIPPSREQRRAVAFAGKPPLPIDAPVLVPAPLTSVTKQPLSTTPPAAVYQPETLRSVTPAIAMHEPLAEDVALSARAEADVSTAQHSSRGWMVLVAACLLVFAAAGWWFLRRPSVTTGAVSQPSPVVEGSIASAPVQPSPAVVIAPLPEAVTPAVREFARKSSALRQPRWGAPASGARYVQPASSGDSPTPAMAIAPTQPRTEFRADSTAPAPITRVAPPSNARVNTPVVPSSVTSGKAANGPVLNSVLAGRLNSPVLNEADAVDDRVAGTRGYPRLLRRKPLVADGTLVAKATPMVVPGARAAAMPSGTVRSTSLGISAGNLVYAPDPAYPTAAALQHISGQVTVQAMVDREGNVASARVVSGPPMLRDAAVNAIQQWRYRPFKAGGKPQTFTATAVMDFQLQ